MPSELRCLQLHISAVTKVCPGMLGFDSFVRGLDDIGSGRQGVALNISFDGVEGCLNWVEIRRVGGKELQNAS